jgi:DNA-binding GntR family transcriptional regulator
MAQAVRTGGISPIGTRSTREEGPMANPMYRQIAEDLREQIESGQLEPGQQLPTELELRDH